MSDTSALVKAGFGGLKLAELASKVSIAVRGDFSSHTMNYKPSLVGLLKLQRKDIPNST